MKRLDLTTVHNLIAQPRLWLVVGIAFIVYSFVFERAGFVRQAQLKHENLRLQQQLTAAQKRMEFLQDEITSLKSDVARLKEEAIRNGYAEPDEVIVRIR